MIREAMDKEVVNNSVLMSGTSAFLPSKVPPPATPSQVAFMRRQTGTLPQYQIPPPSSFRLQKGLPGISASTEQAMMEHHQSTTPGDPKTQRLMQIFARWVQLKGSEAKDNAHQPCVGSAGEERGRPTIENEL